MIYAVFVIGVLILSTQLYIISLHLRLYDVMEAMHKVIQLLAQRMR